jgi:preprotein translocase subunit SecE
VWPTREEGAKLTALVVAISVAIGVLLGAIDFAFAEFFRVLLQR